MKLTNTSRYPTAVVRRLVAFAAAEREVRLTDVNVTNCRWAYRGRAFGGTRRILIRLGPATLFPVLKVQYPGLVTAPVYNMADWQEALVVVAAHEAQHIRQGLAGGRYSEIEAEQAAVSVLHEFRARRVEILAGAEEIAIRQAALRAPETPAQKREGKVEQLEERVAVWRTKLKRAQTWLKKYERRLKRARKVTVQS